MHPVVTADHVRAAAEVLEGRIHRTPCLSFTTGAKRAGGESLFLKCENLQKTGAFKARGALHHLSTRERLPPAGVVTYSSGNHGAATAWAASQLGVAARVFVPIDIPASKKAAAAAYGATVLETGKTSLDRRAAAEAAAMRDGAHIVPPFDDDAIIAGQGTCGLEILDQCPDVRRIVVPVGGGGLVSGIAAAVSAAGRPIEVIGVEPVGCASMGEALSAGHPVSIDLQPSVADGLRPARAGERCHAILAAQGVRVVTVDDAQILAAMKMLFERARVVVEPSGAAALAAYLSRDDMARDGATCVVLSGGNVDVGRFTSLLAD